MLRLRISSPRASLSRPYRVRRRILVQNKPNGFPPHLLNDLFELGEDNEDELLHLIEQRRAFAYVPFPRIVEPPQTGGIAFWNDDRQCTPEPYDISDYPRVLVVCFAAESCRSPPSFSSYAGGSPGQSSPVYP